MKTEKINQVINKIVSKAQESPVPRTNLATKPDIVDIPKRKKPTYAQIMKRLICPHITHLDKKTVRELERMPMEDFWCKSQEIICNSYGIPADLRAPLQINELPKNVAMMYTWDANIIYVSPQIAKKGKNKLFGILKHEYLHQKQNFDVLRTENLGELAIEKYAKGQTELGINNFKAVYRNMSEADIEKLKPQLGEHFEIIMRYKKAVAQGEEAEQAVLDEIFQKDYAVFHKQLSDFRQRVIDEMGIIPANSEEGKIAEEYLKGVFSTQDNLTGIKTIMATRHEIEANIATIISYWEYLIRKIGF